MSDVTPLWQIVIDWFETQYGYNPDPEMVPHGEVLRWAFKCRLDECRVTLRDLRHVIEEAPR